MDESNKQQEQPNPPQETTPIQPQMYPNQSIPAPAPSPTPAPSPFQPAPISEPMPFQAPPTPVMQTGPAPAPVQQMQPQLQPAKKGMGAGAIIGIVIGGFALIGGILGAVFILLTMNYGKVSENDLVTSTTEDTSYLRPKQWSELTSSGVNGYGNKLASDDTSSAIIFVSKGSYLSKTVTTSSSESSISTFRDYVVNAEKDYAESDVKKSGGCSSVSDVHVQTSSVQNQNSVGVFKITATCVKSGDDYHVVYYGLVGNDGYTRTVVLIASTSDWEKNEAIFNKMVDSADQSS